MNTTPKTLGTDLAAADLQLQGLTLWTVPDLVEAIAHGRVHIAPGHDPALTAPTTAREALDLAWELAHEVKEVQIMPTGTRYVSRSPRGGLTTLTVTESWTPDPRTNEVRTLDPLPDPEPDWLDAPAVLANVGDQTEVFTRASVNTDRWLTTATGTIYHWTELLDVVPLYPNENVEPRKSDTLHDAPRQRTVSFRDDKPWGTKLGGDPA